MVELDTIALSVILSAAASGLIAYIFRYRLKPKHEEIFNHNRDANLNIIFGQLNLYDNFVDGFFTIFEQRAGYLTDNRKEIVPRPEVKELPDGGKMFQVNPENLEIWKNYEDLKIDLKPTLHNMLDNFKLFRDDYAIYLNFLHSGFIRDIFQYYNQTNFYAEWSLKNCLIPGVLIDRLETATRIIKYVKKEKIDKKNLVAVDTFIKKWDENQKSRLYESG